MSLWRETYTQTQSSVVSTTMEINCKEVRYGTLHSSCQLVQIRGGRWYNCCCYCLCTEGTGDLRRNLIKEIQGLYFKKNISGTEGWIEGNEPTVREGI